MSENTVASHPDRRCRHYIRLADVPAQVRFDALDDAKKMWPGDDAVLLAAAIYPDPEHGEWIAVEPDFEAAA